MMVSQRPCMGEPLQYTATPGSQAARVVQKKRQSPGRVAAFMNAGCVKLIYCEHGKV